MKNDSKSGLRIREIIITLCVFMIVATSTQFISFKQEENSVVEEVQISDLEQNKSNKVTTSRSGNRRQGNENNVNVEEIKDEQKEESISVEEKKYKTIEEIKISKDMDLTLSCGISKEDFKELMKNARKDTTDFFYNNSDIIYDLCQKYELNEIFFCGLIAGEAGWEISAGHRAKCNYISMMSKGKLIKYESVEHGLEAAAKLLHNKYLSENGAYYSGKTLYGVQKKFCPKSTTWVNLIYTCMKQVLN